ncbi:MAG: hypothetical protein WC548_01220 [Candidatus Pacearchaeota archaeon]
MSECGITNLGSCLVEKLFDFIIYIFNLPLKPLLAIINNLMVEPARIDLFASLWSVIIYMLSLFYGILLLIVGFRFLISGFSPEQREKAKRSLANTMIMMVLVQASYILYSLILELTASLTSGIYKLIPASFFLLESGSFDNIGLQLVLLIPYIITLVITVIFLSLRYICVGAGIVLFPLGIFLYFIEPLQSYGKLILNYLGILIVLPFAYAIILLASSKFLEIGTFSGMKILVMIGGFTLINILTIFLLVFAIIKSAVAIMHHARPVINVVNTVASYV